MVMVSKASTPFRFPVNEPAPAHFINNPREYDRLVKLAAEGNFEAQNKLLAHRAVKSSMPTEAQQVRHSEQVAEVNRLRAAGGGAHAAAQTAAKRMNGATYDFALAKARGEQDRIASARRTNTFH